MLKLQVAEYGDDEPAGQLSRIPIPPGTLQSRRLAPLPFRSEYPGCRSRATSTGWSVQPLSRLTRAIARWGWGKARDPSGRRIAHALDAQACDRAELPSTTAKTAVRCPCVHTERLPAHLGAVPPPSARLRRKPAAAHEVEARLSKVVALRLSARHFVDRVHRSNVTTRRGPSFRPCSRATANGANTAERSPARRVAARPAGARGNYGAGARMASTSSCLVPVLRMP